MSVKIFITRKVSEHKVIELSNLLKRLRSNTLDQPGYIYGETLRRLDKPGEMLVISTWNSLKEWEQWLYSEKRISLQSEVDLLLGYDTEYAVYEE